jgi:tripartite-type tricarboxylate transporter receptor subunit TctC
VNLHRRKFLHLAAGGAALAASRPAAAQAWPSRPIRLLVGFPPGGATDIIARLYGQALSQRLGQPVVIENRPGSGGNMASDAAAKATPDGYTLLHGTDNVFMSNPHIYGRMPFDPFKDLVPVASLSSNQLVLAVHPGVQADNLRDFVELARRSNPPLFYGSIGNGSQHHLAMEMLKQHVGIDLTHVPYRGGGPAAIALLAGEVSAMFGGGSIVPTIHAGKVRGLASTGTDRNPATPAPHDRGTLSRLRGADLARPVRAGRHAGGDHRAPARRDRGGAGAARLPRAACRHWRGRALRRAGGGVRGAHAQRLRQVRQAHPRHRGQGGVRGWRRVCRRPRSSATVPPAVSGCGRCC